MSTGGYIGRFAPSPTGALHFGSLVAALASYLDARAHEGRWLVRMEDVDEARTRPGAADRILRDLERFHLHWDGGVVFQTARKGAYSAAFDKLREQGLVYACSCSRKEAASRHRCACGEGLRSDRSALSWRVRAAGLSTISFEDRIQGAFSQDVSDAVGDFIVRRADGLFAYQLAVVVDDAAQQVTHIVRGADLLDNTPRQIGLQRYLGLPQPSYAHIPVALDSEGRKLSKSIGAAALRGEPANELRRALRFLGHAPPPETHASSISDLMPWAVSAWSIDRVPRAALPIAADT